MSDKSWVPPEVASCDPIWHEHYDIGLACENPSVVPDKEVWHDWDVCATCGQYIWYHIVPT